MKNINVCGKRGLGDIVSGTSFLLKSINHDVRLTYWLPPGFDYTQTLNVIIEQYSYSYPHKIELVVDETWSTVSFDRAVERFGVENFKKTWFFSGVYNTEPYIPFKDSWEENQNGPIGLTLNNENCNPNYPFQSKWFNEKLNNQLLKLIDNKRYFALGRPRSLQDNINVMKKCRYILGVENGWTHIANAMRVPFIISKNNFDMKFLLQHHSKHPCISIIEEYEVFKYLIL